MHYHLMRPTILICSVYALCTLPHRHHLHRRQQHCRSPQRRADQSRAVDKLGGRGSRRQAVDARRVHSCRCSHRTRRTKMGKVVFPCLLLVCCRHIKSSSSPCVCILHHLATPLAPHRPNSSSTDDDDDGMLAVERIGPTICETH